MDDLTANFDELLSEEPEEKEVLFDFKAGDPVLYDDWKK